VRYIVHNILRKPSDEVKIVHNQYQKQHIFSVLFVQDILLFCGFCCVCVVALFSKLSRSKITTFKTLRAAIQVIVSLSEIIALFLLGWNWLESFVIVICMLD
jgi:hypothetical protein